jgi:phenylacetate-CoA ligase
VAEYLAEIDETGALTTLRLRVEPAPGVDGPALVGRIQQAIRAELLFRIDVEAVPPGTLPRAEMKARRWVRKQLSVVSSQSSAGS